MSKALSVNAAASGRQQIFDFLYKWGMLLTVVALVAVFVMRRAINAPISVR